MSQPKPKPKAEPDLFLSPETREMLRQILRVPVLDDDPQLVEAVKDSLQRQYSRGFQEGLVEGARGVPTPSAAPTFGERRSLSPSAHSSPSSRERRQRRRMQRFRRRMRNALTTVVILGMGVVALLAFNAAKPELSAHNPRARHLIDFHNK